MSPRIPGSTVDIDLVSKRLQEVAEEIILPRHRKLGDGDISEKQHGELVTVADLASETWLTRELPNLLPGSLVVGEEAAYADKRVFDRLLDPDPVWVVDPIDGTSNFAKGSDIFAVILALVISGKTVAGWIYEPVGESLAVGETGSGVMLDQQRIDLRYRASAMRNDGVAARYLFARAEADDTFIDDVYRPNCAGHEYIQILRGERRFTAYTKLMPWDHAAGSFIITEAGGRSELLNERPYDLVHPKGDLLSADSDETWRRVKEILAKEDEGGN